MITLFFAFQGQGVYIEKIIDTPNKTHIERFEECRKLKEKLISKDLGVNCYLFNKKNYVEID